MKTMADLETKFKKELEDWRRIKDPFHASYLYYRRTTNKAPGDICITRDAPSPDYELAWAQRIDNRAQTMEQIQNFYRTHVLPHLPVLDI